MTARPPRGWTPGEIAVDPTDIEGLGQIQQWSRELLAELDGACRAAGVPCLLAYGTALGAVREGDLIGWDVDADVWVPREHYSRLLTEVAPLLGPDCELLSPETHPDYEYLFPRVVRRGVHHVFVRVDVFPLDPAPPGRLLRVAYLGLARLLVRLFYLQRVDASVRVHYSRRFRLAIGAAGAVARLVPGGLVLRAFRTLQGAFAGRRTGWLVNSCGSYGQREFLPAEWFASSGTQTLAGRPYAVPARLPELLTHLYGDWAEPPPERQRRFELEAAVARLVRPMRAAGLLDAPASTARTEAS